MKPSASGMIRTTILIAILAASPAGVHAHSIGKNVGDFYWGFLHPIVSLESILPLIALGLLAGQQGQRTARWMIGFFAVGVVIGPLIALFVGTPEIATWMNLGSFVVLGGLLTLGRSWPLGLMAGLAALFGLTQGWGNASELPLAKASFLFASGMIAGAILPVLLLAAVAVGVQERQEWQRIALRIAGSWVAAIGLMVMALR